MSGPRFLLFALLLPVVAPAQDIPRTWRVDAARSRAWYLIEPHYGHLYASTCRYDYDEGARNLKGSSASPGLHSGGDPRRGLSPAGTGHPCAKAIIGEITASNTENWQNLRAIIVVTLDSLFGPSPTRDHHLKTQILDTEKQPFAKFVLDSIVSLKITADTTRAVIAGTMEMNGNKRPVLAPATVWFTPDGALRVNAQVGMHPRGLVTDYKFARRWIGLGWFMWNTMSFGVDLLLREDPHRPAAHPELLTEQDADPESAKKGEKLFKMKMCSSCHSIGKGRVVGPDLKGVTERRTPAWLRVMIMTPEVALMHDTVAQRLRSEHGNIAMPNMRISAQEFEQLLHFLTAQSKK